MASFDTGCGDARNQIVVVLPIVRALIVSAQEETPAATDGFTVDESREEIVDNLKIALRELQSAAMRLNVAKHVFLGDSTLEAPATTAATPPAPASTDAARTGAVQGPA